MPGVPVSLLLAAAAAASLWRGASAAKQLCGTGHVRDSCESGEGCVPVDVLKEQDLEPKPVLYCGCCGSDSHCGEILENGYPQWLCVTVKKGRKVRDDEGRCQAECRHKDLFPVNNEDIVCFFVVTASLILAAGTGMGGGGLLVPTFMFIAGFDADGASPLSSATITGGALANVAGYMQQWHPTVRWRPLIDYEVVLLVMPALLAGTEAGAVLESVLPLWLITLLLFVLLTALAVRTTLKAAQLWHDEREAQRQLQRAAEAAAASGVAGAVEALREQQGHSAADEPIPAGVSLYPRTSIAATACAWAVTGLFAILKGSPTRGSPVTDVECGTAAYWFLILIPMAVMGALTWWVRGGLLAAAGGGARRREMLAVGTREDSPRGSDDVLRDGAAPAAPPGDDDSRWGRRNTLWVPVVCAGCGVAAGMLGIGGGIIVGPLLLELGLHPRAVAATSAVTVLVTASSATVQYLVMHMLLKQYTVVYMLLGFCATVAGQRAMESVIRRLNMSSAISIAIALVLILASLALGYRSVDEQLANARHHAPLGFRSLCA